MIVNSNGKYNSSNLCNIPDINNSPLGFLNVKVSEKIINTPITFAVVSVYFLNIRGIYGESGDAYLYVRHVTDEDGKVPTIILPIIDKSVYPNSQYYMNVHHFRYYPVNLFRIQIYPNIATSYSIMMTPLTAENPDYDFIINPEDII